MEAQHSGRAEPRREAVEGVLERFRPRFPGICSRVDVNQCCTPKCQKTLLAGYFQRPSRCDAHRPNTCSFGFPQCVDAAGEIQQSLLGGVLGRGRPGADDETRCSHDERLELAQEVVKRRAISAGSPAREASHEVARHGRLYRAPEGGKGWLGFQEQLRAVNSLVRPDSVASP